MLSTVFGDRQEKNIPKSTLELLSSARPVLSGGVWAGPGCETLSEPRSVSSPPRWAEKRLSGTGGGAGGVSFFEDG